MPQLLRVRSISACVAVALTFGLSACASPAPGGSVSSNTPAPNAASPSSTPALPLAVVTPEIKPSCVKPEDTVLARGDGPVAAIAYGTGSAILMSQQNGQDICGLDSRGRELAELGYRVVLVDANAQDPETLLVDVAAWAKETGSAKIGLIGASRGGTFVLAATPKIGPAVTIALSPPTAFATSDALAAMPEIDTPTLIIAGANDDRFPSEAEKLGEADPDAKVTIVPNSYDHGNAYLRSDSPVQKDILDFLSANLGD